MKSMFVLCVWMTVSLAAQERYEGRILEHGMKGLQVKRLQYDLYFLGYAVYLEAYGGATGEFNQATTNAVVALQRDRGLVQHGIVDRKTTAAIVEMLAATEVGANHSCYNPLRYDGRRLGVGHRDDSGKKIVSQLQRDLKKLGFSCEDDPAGEFSTHTQQALRSFQEEALIPQTGITDEHTTVQLAARLCFQK